MSGMKTNRKRKIFLLDIKKVEAYRHIHKMDKKDIAKALGVRPTVVSYIYKKASAKWAPAIADIWGLDGKDFIEVVEIDV